VFKYAATLLILGATMCSAATQRVPGSRVIIDTTGFEEIDPANATLQGILDWIDGYWLTLGTGFDWGNITNVPPVWSGTVPFTNVTGHGEFTGTVNFASVTNLPSVWPGSATGIYVVSTLGTVTNTALTVTNGPHLVIVPIATNVTLSMGTNGTPGIFDGYCLKWRVTASGGNRILCFPTNTFRIPTSSSLTTNQTLTNGTTSVFLTEYNGASGRWMLEAYVSGY
jgi:hypothetical protein